jgi:hypothetical protein
MFLELWKRMALRARSDCERSCALERLYLILLGGVSAFSKTVRYPSILQAEDVMSNRTDV